MASNPALDDDAYQQQRADFYARLGVAAGPLGKKDSKAATKQAKANAKASAKADKEAHEKARKVARHKVLYEDRRKRAEATIAALRDYSPATDAMISRFIDSLLEADRILQADHSAFEAANKALHHESVSKAMGQADKAWNQAEKDARKNKASAPAYAKLDALRKTLASSRAALADAAIDAYLERTLKAERTLLKGGAAAAGEVSNALDAIAAEVGAAQNEASQAQAAAKAARTRAEAMLLKIDAPDPLGALVTAADRAVLQRLRTGADTAMGSRDFMLAKDQFDDLVSRAQGLAGAGTGERTAWTQRAAELTRLSSEVSALAAGATSPAVRSVAAALGTEMGALAKLKVGTEITFGKALAKLDGGLAALADLNAEEALFKAFAKDREGAAKRIAVLDDAAVVAFQPLRAAVLAVTDGQQNDLADRPFTERLERVRAGWKHRLANAQNADVLDEDGAAIELRAIARDLAAAAGDDAVLDTLLDDEKLRVAQAAYRSARSAAMAAVTRLTNIDAPAGAGLLDQLNAVHTALDARATAGAYEGASSEVAKLMRAADLAAAGKDTLASGLQMRLEQVLAPLPAQLALIPPAVQKMPDAAGQKPHLALHETLSAALTELRAMGQLKQVHLLEEAIDDGLQLTKEIAAAVAAATKGEPPDDVAMLSFDDAKKRLAKLKAKLADKDVQMYARISAFDAERRAGDMERGLGSTTPSALEKALDELTVTVESVEGKAAAAKLDCEAFFKDEVKPVQVRLEAAPIKDAKAYATAMKARLESVRSDARFEGGLADARTALARIVTELDDLPASGVDDTGAPRALVAKEKDALQAQRQQELDKTRFEAEVLVLEKLIEGAKGLDADDHEGLRQSLRDAKKAAAKGSNYDDAREQLRSIRQRHALLAQNPQGLSIHVRKQLPAVHRRYRAAVSGYWGGLDAVGQAIAALPAADLADDAKALVRAELGAVRVLYNPAVFDRSLSLVANEATAANERSAQREAALREARRLGAYLKDDFRLQQLAETPFHAPMRGLLSELRLALLDLENNLLVSM